MRILAYQGPAAFADKAANIAEIRRVARSAAALGVKAAIFPEMFLTGYNIGERARELAEPVDGQAIGALRETARASGVALVVGFPESDGDRVCNSAVAIDPSGAIAGLHRKVQLFGTDEAGLFEPGSRFEAFDFLGRRCGLSICYDIEFPEVGRTLARQDVRLVLNPTANMEPYFDVPTTLVRARALENAMTIVYANLCGSEGNLAYTGLSCVVGPDGNDIVRAGRDPAILIAEIGAALDWTREFPLSTQLADLRVR